MILSKLPCPDCAATGVDVRRGGLCRRCHGEGRARPTADEEAMLAGHSHRCACVGGTGTCDGRCGTCG